MNLVGRHDFVCSSRENLCNKVKERKKEIVPVSMPLERWLIDVAGFFVSLFANAPHERERAYSNVCSDFVRLVSVRFFVVHVWLIVSAHCNTDKTANAMNKRGTNN